MVATFKVLARTHTKWPHCEVTMYWVVKAVKGMSDYRIDVEVEDGRRGIFNPKPYLERGVFHELKDITPLPT